MTKLYFKETQKFNLSWKWLLFISLYILMFWALSEQLTEPGRDLTAIFSMVFSLLMIIVFNIILLIMKLETEINQDRIKFQFKPFHLKPRVIDFNEIQEYNIREYKPLKEYGGYGIQHRIKSGRSYTISGKVGLQIVLKTGKKILIGTNKSRELQDIINKLKEN